MIRVIALLASLSMLSSCATVLARDTRSVIVTSNPPGAQITINGMPSGMTPATLVVNDHKMLRVAITMPGYQSAGCYIDTSVGAVWVVLDLLLFYTIVPLVIDLITNEWSSLDHGHCSVNLMPLSR